MPLQLLLLHRVLCVAPWLETAPSCPQNWRGCVAEGLSLAHISSCAAHSAAQPARAAGCISLALLSVSVRFSAAHSHSVRKVGQHACAPCMHLAHAQLQDALSHATYLCTVTRNLLVHCHRMHARLARTLLMHCHSAGVGWLGLVRVMSV